MAALTFALTFFGWVQLRQIRSERLGRKRAAYGAVWVEYWRIWTTVSNWSTGDLVVQARAGLIDPEDILPQDWGAVLPLLGELGMQSSRLAGMAYANARNANRHARGLIALVQGWEAHYEERRTMNQGETDLEDYPEYLAQARKTEANTRELARRAAAEFEDALKSAPKWLHIEEWNPEGLTSATAKGIETDFHERGAYPQGRWLWLARRWVATSLGRIASAVSPVFKAPLKSPTLPAPRAELPSKSGSTEGPSASGDRPSV